MVDARGDGQQWENRGQTNSQGPKVEKKKFKVIGVLSEVWPSGVAFLVPSTCIPGAAGTWLQAALAIEALVLSMAAFLHFALVHVCKK